MEVSAHNNRITRLHARKRKRGFTLTEIAIVLGIIGLILGAIWSAAASVYSNQRIAHANTAILQVTQGVRTLMTTSSTVGAAGDITASIISAAIIPPDLISTTTSAIGPWAGSTIKVLTVAATDTGFTVEMNNIPQAACIALISTVAGASRDPGLTAVGAKAAAAPIASGIAGTALGLSSTPIAIVTPAEAATACSIAGSTNFAQFEFTLK